MKNNYKIFATLFAALILFGCAGGVMERKRAQAVRLRLLDQECDSIVRQRTFIADYFTWCDSSGHYLYKHTFKK